MEEPSIFLVFFKDSFNNKVKMGLFMNECLDSTMGHIHVCFDVLLPRDDPRTSRSFLDRGEFWMWEMESEITRLMCPSVLHTDTHASETSRNVCNSIHHLVCCERIDKLGTRTGRE